MSRNETLIQASPERVWEVLADGWTYPLWVVGASRMRAVDENWPEVGARLHHSVGTWPVLLDDYTEVTAVDARRLPDAAGPRPAQRRRLGAADPGAARGRRAPGW